MNQDRNSCKKSFVAILWALCLNAKISYYIVENKMAYQDYLMIYAGYAIFELFDTIICNYKYLN